MAAGERAVTEPARARQEGASNAGVCLYRGGMASHVRTGVKLEGIQWATKMIGAWRMLPMGRGGRRWLGESEGEEVGGDQATAYSGLEGMYREDGVKLVSALTSDTRGNGHTLHLG